MSHSSALQHHVIYSHKNTRYVNSNQHFTLSETASKMKNKLLTGKCLLLGNPT